MIDDESDRLAAEVVTAANRAIGLLEAYKSTAAKNAAVARGQAAKVRDVARFEARHEQRIAVERARQAVVEQVAKLARGPLGARWAELEALSDVVGVLDAAEYIRCGSVTSKQRDSTGIEAPLVLPLLDHGNLRIAASAERRDAASGAIQEILLRSLLGTGPGQLTLHGFDPKLSATLAMFTPLRQASEEVVRPALAGSDDLRALFERLSQDVRRISDMYGGSPTTLGEFRRSAQQPIEHYQVVTILDYPTAFDERLNQLLLTLTRTGPSCAISFVIHHATDVVPADGVVVDDVRPEAVSLDLNDYSVDVAPGFQVRAGAAPNVAVVEPALANLATRIRQAAAPKIDFLDLQPPPNAYWTERSADRVSAVVGRTGHQPIEITLGDEIEQMHNILVTGAVGQGKSNLLMTLVHSWALRYPPSEIELYLLDFRDGVQSVPVGLARIQQGLASPRKGARAGDRSAVRTRSPGAPGRRVRAALKDHQTLWRQHRALPARAT